MCTVQLYTSTLEYSVWKSLSLSFFLTCGNQLFDQSRVEVAYADRARLPASDIRLEGLVCGEGVFELVAGPGGEEKNDVLQVKHLARTTRVPHVICTTRTQSRVHRTVGRSRTARDLRMYYSVSG